MDVSDVKLAVDRAYVRASKEHVGLRGCIGVGCSKWGTANQPGPKFNCGTHCEKCGDAGWHEEDSSGQSTVIPCRCHPAWLRMRVRADGLTHMHCNPRLCKECRQLTGTSAPPEEVEREQRDRLMGRR